MAKVLLVEDDNNLREIYEARLQAEGYTIVSANDGEAALVVAKNEKPDLVISDVMMPKISGFEMLDILRNTDGLKDVKVIMLTALGQADDQARADKLGADRYLVKSQVTLEDIVRVSHELLDGDAAPAPADVPAPAEPAVAATPAPEPAPAPAPEPPVSAPAADQVPVAPAPAEPAQPIAVATPPEEPAATAAPAPEPVPAPAPEPPAAPVPEPVPVPEPATEPVTQPPAVDDATAQSSASEEATVQQQIEDFVNSQSATPPPAAEPEAVPAQDSAAAANDASLEQAVDTLTQQAEAAPVEVPAPQANQESTAAPEVADESSTHKKKVIQPPAAEPGKSLDQLLAEEEAKQPSSVPEPVIGSGQEEDLPSGAPTPSPSSQAETTGPDKPFDPNSIAL